MEFLVWLIFGAVALLVDVLANKQKRQRQRERAQQSPQSQQQAEYDDEDDFSFEEYQVEMERQWREEQARKQHGDLAPERTVVWESPTLGKPTKETPYVTVPTVDGGFMIPVPPVLQESPAQESPAEERHVPISVSVQPTAMPTAVPTTVPSVWDRHAPVAEWAKRAKRHGRISRSEARSAVVLMEILGKPKGLA